MRSSRVPAWGALLVVLLAAGAAGVPAQAPLRTFGRVLADQHIDARGLPADTLGALVSEVALDEGAEYFAVADHAAQATGHDPDPRLHVHVRDNGTGTWRSAAVDPARAGGNAVTQVRQTQQWTLVDVESPERARRTLVLDGTLTLRRRLEAALVAVLPDGVVLLQDDASAFAPSHPVSISAYAPERDEVGRIHPLPPFSSVRQRFAERVQRAYAGWGMKACLAAGHPCNAERFDAALASDVVYTARGARIAWVLRFGPPEEQKDGPVDFRTYVVAACDREIGSTTATCRERAFGAYDGPDGEETRGVLAAVLSGRVP